MVYYEIMNRLGPDVLLLSNGPEDSIVNSRSGPRTDQRRTARNRVASYTFPSQAAGEMSAKVM